MGELADKLKRLKGMWASQITEKIYLGSGNHAGSLKKLQLHKITHILNVADDVENFYPNNFIYKNLNVADFGADKGISRVFYEAFEFYNNEIENNENAKLLIHCAAGANRSVTVTIALLMLIEKFDLKTSWKYVKKRRVGACPLMDNRLELVKFELELLKSNSLPAEDFFYILEREKD